MERKNIAYTKGITRSPSDILCSDGELAECVNLEVRNEELVPMEIPLKLGFSCGTGETLVLVHDIKSGPKNYITVTNGILKAFKVTGSTKSYYSLLIACGDILSIQKIGNIIVVYTEDTPHYIQYKNNDYIYLGSKIPEIGLSFDLSGAFVLSDIFQVTTPNLEYTTDEFQSDVVNQLLAQVNSFVSEQIDGNSKFMFPFFVRYALRLYDGTYCMQSNPILMYPSSSISPELRYIRSMSDSNMKDRTYDSQLGAFVSDLKATVSNVSDDFDNWKEIISGLDIFISKQIYTYDQNGTHFGNYTIDQHASQFIGEYNGRSSIVNAYTTMASKTTLSPGSKEYLAIWNIPMKGLDEIYDEIANVSSFHKFASIGLDEITSGNVIKLEGTISAIETNETLPDDYMSHDILLPQYSFVYNGRINISNVTREFYQGQKIQCITQMVKNAPTGSGYDLHFGNVSVVVCISSSNGGGDIIVESGLGDYGALWGSYLFYPDPNAYKMVIIDYSNYKYAEIPLNQHPLLNGSYAFIGFKALPFSSGFPYPTGSGNKESISNKLFTSEVNNPFHFPLEGINTIGSGDIIGMAAMTRPISTGQAGEAPFIVFCTDGNYALKVDAEGYYERIFPIQEDRVLGNEKITPLEDSIAIITKKGLMITNAGDITKIAGNMDGSPFEGYPYISESEELKPFKNMALQTNDSQSFLSYLEGARMAYDYSSNRLIIYNPDMTYTYVYSFDNGTTSKMSIDGVKIITSVIDYPDTIIQDENGNLYSLYAKEDTSSITERKFGVAVTRPLKLDNPIAYKIINQIKNLKKTGKDSYIKYALYGSMDGNNFVHINSLRKRSYLYYIFVVYTYMLPKESFSGTIISFDYRMSHKFR